MRLPSIIAVGCVDEIHVWLLEQETRVKVLPKYDRPVSAISICVPTGIFVSVWWICSYQKRGQRIFFSHFAYICNFLCSITTFSYYYPPSPLSISSLLHFYHLHYIISQHMPLPLLLPLPSLAVSDAVNVVVLNSFHRRFIQLSICRKYQEI